MPNFQMEHVELRTTADYQKVVEAIGTILCLDSDVEVAAVSAVHQKYVEAVRRVNDRLKTCDERLQKGLRSEALQLAKQEPKLLDVLNVLEFDEKAIWNNYAQQCGLSPAPELLSDVADDIQTAWAAEEPLADLMYRHRLHALARSPLPLRIDVLRKLTKMDHANKLWEEELKIFETARLADVVDECKTAAAQNDLSRLSALETELKSGEWRVAPSSKLVSFTGAKVQEVKAKYARAKLNQLEPLLNAAYLQADVETARRLRREWQQEAQIAKLGDQDGLALQVKEPLKWLVEKDRADREEAAYQAAVQELELALNQQAATKADFEPLYYKIEQFGRGVPELLQDRLTQRIEELDRLAAQQRRKKWLIAVTSSIATLIAVGVVIFLAVRSAELSAHVANLSGLIQDEQLDKAEVYAADLEANNPRVHGDPEIQTLLRELDTAVKADQDRRTLLAQLIATATQYGADELKADQPPSLGKVSLAYNALRQAHDEVAKTETERANVLALRDEIRANELAVQKAVDAQFNGEVDELHRQVKALDPEDSGYPKSLNSQKQTAETLKTRKWISPTLGQQRINPILVEMADLMAKDQLARAEDVFLFSLREAIGNHGPYRSRLDAYVQQERFAGSPRYRHFQQVLKDESALWVGFEAWQQLRGRLERAGDLTKVSGEEATMLLANANDVLQNHQGFPAEAEIAAIAGYLNLVVVREQGTLVRNIKDLLKQPIVRDLYWLATAKDGKFYSTQKPTQSGGKWVIRYAKDIALSGDVGYKSVDPKDIKNNPVAGGGNFVWESPQWKFSKLALAKLDNVTSETWEKDFLDVLSTLHADQEMDEFVKFKLIESLEATACAGSLYLQTALAKNLDRLNKEAGDIDPNANWIDPTDQNGIDERRDAADLIGKMTNPQDALKGLPAYLAGLQNVQLGPEYDWVGWLHRDRKNQWTVSFKSAPDTSRSASLFVLTRASSGGPVTFNKIGDLKTGQVRVSVSESSPALVEGRPIYEQRASR